MNFYRLVLFLKYALAAALLSLLMWFSVGNNLPAEQHVAPLSPPKDTLMHYSLTSPSLPLEEKIRLMVKSPQLEKYFSIEPDGVTMFASPWHKKTGKAECKVYFDEVPAFLALSQRLSREELMAVYQQKGKQRLDSLALAPEVLEVPAPALIRHTPSQPLQGLRVALDPGHLGGDMQMAILEGKFVRMRDENGTVREFNEGNINLLTAQVLAEKLRAMGAVVLLTRNEAGHSAFGKDYPTWLQEDFQREVKRAIREKEISWPDADFLVRRANRRQIFHQFFKHLDFKERARLINAFQPHLTIVIHYNVDEKNYLSVKSDNTMKACDNNLSMAFVGGGFLQNELGYVEGRLAFLRLLVSEDLGASVLLAGAVADQYAHGLGVPHADVEKVKYLSVATVPAQAPGVFARNLALTRLINGPICYGESFYQDNAQEFARLTNGQNPPKRLEEVADAYLYGIMEFVRASRKIQHENEGDGLVAKDGE